MSRMKKSLCNGIAASLACLPMILPPPVLAAAPQPIRVERPYTHVNPRQSAVVDVALRDRGQLTGRVVIANGTAAAGVPVSLAYRGQAIAKTATDTQGRFALVGRPALASQSIRLGRIRRIMGNRRGEFSANQANRP